MGWLWWIGAALVLGILEMLSLDLVLVMFAGGALAGAIAYLLGASVPVQFVVAALTSVLLLVTLRPWLLRHLRARMPLVETNAAALVGREAVVVSTGHRSRVAASSSPARCGAPGWTPPQTIPPGTEVRVARIDGATAVVAPVPGALTPTVSHVARAARPRRPLEDPWTTRTVGRSPSSSCSRSCCCSSSSRSCGRCGSSRRPSRSSSSGSAATRARWTPACTC